MSISISGLCSYPVKSLAAEPVDSLSFSAMGAWADRRWMLVDVQGKFITQRQYPSLCRIMASSSGEEGACLELRCLDSGQTLTVSAEGLKAGAVVSVQVWSDTVFALDAGDEAGAWFSERMAKPVRLVYFSKDYHRQVDPAYAQLGDGVSFADGFPVLLANMASLAVLQAELDQRGWNDTLSMWRFRPNIVIDGADAFAENHWRRVGINGIALELVKPCSRCAIPTIRPSDGRRQKEVFQVLRKHCLADDGEVYFGQNALLRFPPGKTQTEFKSGMLVDLLE